tara:strand:- start:1001 stop:1768 length:768 start_codon:yes stop_codon:yes gene_type:complete
MSEEAAVVEPVADNASESVTATPAPIPPNPPVSSPEGSASEELLQKKLGFANSQAAKAKKEAEQTKKQLAKLQSEVSQLQETQQTAKRENLESQGAYKELYEAEKERSKTLETRLLNETSELRTELESVTQSANTERLKSSSLAAISQSNALNPEQMYTLLQPLLRQSDEGNPTVLNGGVEQSLSEYLGNLKQSKDWQHHFSAGGSRGMGSNAASPSVAPGMTNPYKLGNMTEALKLEAENPELARVLKAEAQRG